MAEKLFEFHDDDDWQGARAKSHQALERVLEEGQHPKAECREDMGTLMFSVWTGREGTD